MTNYNLEEIDSFSIQLILTALTIGTLLVSMTLTYNEKLKLKNEPLLFTDEESKNLLILSRTLAVFIGIGFLILNFVDREAKKNDGKINLKFADMQVEASILSLVSAFIVLYVVMNDTDEGIISNENPTL